MPFVLAVFRARGPNDEARALVVEDAIHCGVCTPRGEPVPLPELDEQG
jgi:hypothetical protein